MQKIYPARLLKKLANLKFAVFLLFLIGIVIAIGTIVEQNQSTLFYQENYPMNNSIFRFFDWNFIIRFQLDHIYTSYGFLCLLFLLVSSLISCTFTVQFPVLQRLKHWSFVKNPKLKSLITDTKLNTIQNSFNLQLYLSSYTIFKQGRNISAYCGLIGKISPIVVHASLISLLLGCTIGNFGGYVAQEIVPRGESFHIQNLIKSGQLSKVKQDISWRVNDFWITYTENLKINQFYSDLSLLDETGNEVKRKTLFVNEPFKVKGITLYQTDWDLIGIKIAYGENRTEQVPLKLLNKEGQKFWFGKFKTNESLLDTVYLSILCKDTSGNVFVYNQKGELIKTVMLGRPVQLTEQGPSVIFSELITSTGLQIKADPGIGIIYFSFFFLMVSTYTSFVTYSQIWGMEKERNFVIIGTSTRAVLYFQNQFKQLINRSDNNL